MKSRDDLMIITARPRS